MKVFAIGDLHLEGGNDKPMDVFGAQWNQHFQRIEAAWRQNIGSEDLVLLPGDISWAMKLERAQADLESIARLPGQKILLRGNHDYWWTSISKLRALLTPGMYAIQNDSLTVNGVTVVGSRGWLCPGSSGWTQEDERIYEREVQRLRLSLEHGADGALLVGMMHFPPFNERRQPSGFTQLFEKFGVKNVVYGHLHGRACRNAFEGGLNGVCYHLCSCDHIGFSPKKIFTEISGI